MKVHTFWEKNKNGIITMLIMAVNTLLMSLFFDFYYDLNDDVMMKNIMAGVYTGTPDGHNMQTLYILGAVISLCYRLCREIPWYGLFLFLCQMGSFYLTGVRLLSRCRKIGAKLGSMIVLSIFMWGIMLSHLTAIQYTITVAVMAAAAIVLFLTTPKELSARQFIWKNIPSILLVVLAYQLRTEMLLLVFPLICLAGLFRWLEEDSFFTKENYGKYGIVLGCILVGMLGSRLLDGVAYGSDEWQKFLTFFDKRTEVYDYHYEVLTSGEHSQYLSSLGLHEAQQELLSNYNFGLDESIDEEVLGEIAAYADEYTEDTKWTAQRLEEKGRYYLYRTLHSQDAPYNYLILLGYFCAAVSGIWQIVSEKRWKITGELALLGIFRTVLWMYILMMGREPVRITHSLYLVEFAVLTGILWNYGKIQIPAVLFSLFFVCCLPESVAMTKEDIRQREAVNTNCLAIMQYCKVHPDSFYFEDVYSTVSFSEKIFEPADCALANYDIMGGWMCKSPLYYEKLEQFGITTAEEALLTKDNVYVIAETENMFVQKEKDENWLCAYYASKGKKVVVEQVDQIQDDYVVYQVVEQ